MKFLGSATVSSKNQITIPLKVIKEMELKKGEPLIFLKDERGHVYITTEIALPEKE